MAASPEGLAAIAVYDRNNYNGRIILNTVNRFKDGMWEKNMEQVLKKMVLTMS